MTPVPRRTPPARVSDATVTGLPSVTSSPSAMVTSSAAPGTAAQDQFAGVVQEPPTGPV